MYHVNCALTGRAEGTACEYEGAVNRNCHRLITIAWMLLLLPPITACHRTGQCMKTAPCDGKRRTEGSTASQVAAWAAAQLGRVVLPAAVVSSGSSLTTAC